MEACDPGWKQGPVVNDHRWWRGGRLGRVLCYYTAIKGAPLGKVMPIAFTSPLFGALMGIIFSGEPLTPKTILGSLLTIGGIIVLTIA